MLTLSVNHPDVEEFITIKQDLTKVTGANISVLVTDEFMAKIANGEDHLLRWPLEANVSNINIDTLQSGSLKEDIDAEGNKVYVLKVNAKKLWETLIKCAWSTAEPGIMYLDKHLDYSPDTVYAKYKGVCTNPCFRGDTPILTSQGYMNIESLVDFPHLELINYQGQQVPAKVWSNGVKDIVGVTLSNGKIIHCTPDHRFMTIDREELKISDCFGKRIMPFINILKSTGLATTEGLMAGVEGIQDFNTLCSLWDDEGLGQYLSAYLSCQKYPHITIDGITLQLEGSKAYNTVSKILSKLNIKVSGEYCDGNGSYGIYIEDFSTYAEKIGVLHDDEESILVELIVSTAPEVISIEDAGQDEVFDFTLYDSTHWGIVEGVVAHNCSEIFMSPYDSCRLGSIRYDSFVIKTYEEGDKFEDYFDVNKFDQVCAVQSRLMDDLVDLEAEYVGRILDCIEDKSSVEYNLWLKIEDMCKSSRRAGSGFTAMGDMVAKAGFKFDSSEGIEMIKEVSRRKFVQEFIAQVELAKDRGSFLGFDYNLEYDSDEQGRIPFFINLKESLIEVLGEDEAKKLFEIYKVAGRRNVSWSTAAPNGSISIMTQTTSGIEPLFKPYYIRRKKCMNEGDRVDFVDKLGVKFMEFVTIHPQFNFWALERGVNFKEYVGAELEKKLDDEFKESPWFGSLADDIDWSKRVEIQGIVQKYTTHSISSTVNLPNTATVEDVANIYELAWKHNLKGITVYRDGCREGVLVSTEKKDCGCAQLTHSAPKRSKEMPADIKRFKNGKERWIAAIGLMGGKPYEIFTGIEDSLDLPDYVTEAKIVKGYDTIEVVNEITGQTKNKRVSRYDIVYVDKNGKDCTVTGLSKVFNPEYYNYSKLISGILRHGMSPEYVVSTIESMNMNNDTVNSWKSGVTRALKPYITNPTKEVCPACGEEAMVPENGCKVCKACGHSGCS